MKAPIAVGRPCDGPTGSACLYEPPSLGLGDSRRTALQQAQVVRRVKCVFGLRAPAHRRERIFRVRAVGKFTGVGAVLLLHGRGVSGWWSGSAGLSSDSDHVAVRGPLTAPASPACAPSGLNLSPPSSSSARATSLAETASAAAPRQPATCA